MLFVWQDVESSKKLAVYAKNQNDAKIAASKLAAKAGELGVLQAIWDEAGPIKISEAEPGIFYFDESGVMTEGQWELLAVLSHTVDSAISSNGADVLEKLQLIQTVLNDFCESLVE